MKTKLLSGPAKPTWSGSYSLFTSSCITLFLQASVLATYWFSFCPVWLSCSLQGQGLSAEVPSAWCTLYRVNFHISRVDDRSCGSGVGQAESQTRDLQWNQEDDEKESYGPAHRCSGTKSILSQDAASAELVPGPSLQGEQELLRVCPPLPRSLMVPRTTPAGGGRGQ